MKQVFSVELVKSCINNIIIVLSRDIFVSRDIITKIAMWMGSLSWKACCNALCKRERIFTLTDFEWEGQELKPEICKVAHGRLVAHTWLSDYFYPEK